MWQHHSRTRKGIDIWVRRATGRKGYEYDISTPTGTGTTREPMGRCVYTSLKAAREAAAQSARYNLTH